MRKLWSSDAVLKSEQSGPVLKAEREEMAARKQEKQRQMLRRLEAINEKLRKEHAKLVPRKAHSFGQVLTLFRPQRIFDSTRIRQAVHFEGTLSRDAHSLMRAEESHDVVPMLCHFACRAELATAGVDLLPSKPLARIRNLQYLKIAGCSVMLARTVRAQVPTAPGSRAALAGSLPQFWAGAESCRSIPTSRGTMMFALKSEPRPADAGAVSPHCFRFPRTG
eukprot:s7446_g2.t1